MNEKTLYYSSLCPDTAPFKEAMAMTSVCANAMPSSGKTAKNEPVSTVTASRENTKPPRASIAIIQTDNSSHSQPTKNQIIPTEQRLRHFMMAACKRLNIGTDRKG